MGTNGDKLRLKKVSFRLPSKLVEECEREALNFKLPLSEVLRDRFLQKLSSSTSHFDTSSPLIQRLQDIEQKMIDLQLSHAQDASLSSQESPLVVEILFLLREFLFERNAQILKKVDEKLERRFGKDRKRVG